MIDAKLLNRVLNQEAQAFEELYTLKYADAFRLARSKTNNNEDAEEAVQNAMLIVFQKLDTLKNVSSFDSWFYKIIVNCALNVTRKNQKEPINFSDINPDSELDFEDTLVNDRIDFSPEDFSDKQDLIETVGMIMEELSEDQRFCLQLYYYNNMKISDIAEALEVPESTIKTRLSRGKSKFEAIAKEYEKKGFKLFGAIPLFFERSFRNIVVPSMPYSKVIAPALATSTTATVATTGAVAGSTAVAGKGAAVAGTVAAGSIAKKVIAGIVAVGIIVGGAGTIASVVKKHNSPPVSVTETTESATESTTLDDEHQKNIEEAMNYSNKNTSDTVYSEKMIVDNNKIYYCDRNEKTEKYSLNMIDTNTNKTSILTDGINVSTMLIHKNKLFFTGEYDGNLYCFDLNNKNASPKIIDSNLSYEGYGGDAPLQPFYVQNGKLYYLTYGNAIFIIVEYDIDTEKTAIYKEVDDDFVFIWDYDNIKNNDTIVEDESGTDKNTIRNKFETSEYIILYNNNDSDSFYNQEYIITNLKTGDKKTILSTKEYSNKQIFVIGAFEDKIIIDVMEYYSDGFGGTRSTQIVEWDDIDNIFDNLENNQNGYILSSQDINNNSDFSSPDYAI